MKFNISNMTVALAAAALGAASCTANYEDINRNPYEVTAEDMERAAQAISETYGCAVLCKGGHQIHDADDLLWRDGQSTWFRGRRIDNPNTHGTGCTLSSAIASNLAKGYDLTQAVERSKAYISGALAAMLDLGAGSGPMDHLFALRGEFVDD